VVSDCGAISDFWQSHKVSSDATHAAAKGALAGTDVECGFGYTYAQLPAAVAKGLIREEDIDLHVTRALAGRFELGEMDNDSLVEWSKIPLSVVNNALHKELALKMARESMTLLQNKDHLLPLQKSGKRIAVIGPNAADSAVMWGNYNGTPFHTMTILDGIKAKLSPGKTFYDRGCDLTEDSITVSVIGQCSIDGKAGIKATYWNNRDRKGNMVTTEQLTRPMKLTTAGQHQFAEGVHLQDFSALYETVYKAGRSQQLVFKVKACGAFELRVNGQVLNKFGTWRPVPARIPLMVEQGKEYRIEVRFSQLSNWTASLDLNFGEEVPVKFDELVEKLKGIDVVIFAGGISSQLEGEEMPVELPGFKGGDRTDIQLPAVQRNCIKALKQAGKKIIFVDCSGSAMGLSDEVVSCDAILQAWYGGESGGRAVADVLFGDYNPGGKLPITFYKNIQQLPDFEDYSMKGRTYRYMSDPLFPFGFGLSYTSFSIGTAKVSDSLMNKDDSITLTVPLINTGSRAGTEVVQVYVHKTGDPDGPLKTLRGFRRVELAAGEKGQAVFTLSPDAFAFFDRDAARMQVSAGIYEVWYGVSSDAKDLKQVRIKITSE